LTLLLELPCLVLPCAVVASRHQDSMPLCLAQLVLVALAAALRRRAKGPWGGLCWGLAALGGAVACHGGSWEAIGPPQQAAAASKCAGQLVLWFVAWPAVAQLCGLPLPLTLALRFGVQWACNHQHVQGCLGAAAAVGMAGVLLTACACNWCYRAAWLRRADARNSAPAASARARSCEAAAK
jgi:hypothetical protein